MAWSGSAQVAMVALASADKSYRSTGNGQPLPLLPQNLQSTLVQLVDSYTQYLALQGLIASNEEFIQAACVAAGVVRDIDFPTNGAMVASDFLLGLLGINGFCVVDVNKRSLVEASIRDAVAHLVHNQDLGELTAFVQRNLVHMRAIVPNDDIAALFNIASTMSEVAEDVPLGSLASAIADVRKCTILLRAHKPLNTSENRAVYWYREGRYDREYWILYAPAEGGRSVYDARTRYAVAHELAHVLLDHDLSNGKPSARDEQEAHVMAAAFLRHQGPPERRNASTFSEVVSVVAESKSLAAATRIAMLREIERHFVGHPGRPTATDAAISQYFGEVLVRRWAGLELELGIQAALGQ